MKISDTTLFLSIVGWRPISDMGLLDFVALNWNNNRIEIFPASAVSISKGKYRDHLSIRGDYVWTKTDLDSDREAARILVAHDRVKPFLEFKDLTLSEVYLLGIVLTDAHFTKTGHIEIYQSLRKKHVADKIEQTLLALNATGSLYERERGGKHYTWRLSSEFSEHFKGTFDLHDRSLPSINLLFLPMHLRNTLLRAMMDGDGTWNDENHGVFYKPSLIDFFQIIAMSLGFKSKVNPHRKQIYISNTGHISNTGYGEHQIWTEPDMTPVRQRAILYTIAIDRNDESFSPLFNDNGKIFFGEI